MQRTVSKGNELLFDHSIEFHDANEFKDTICEPRIDEHMEEQEEKIKLGYDA